MRRNDLIEKAKNAFYSADSIHQQLYHCQAEVATNSSHSFAVLRSYNTIVAYCDLTVNPAVVYVFNYYSATTNSTHISKFRNLIREKYRLSWSEIEVRYLYKHSGLSNRAYRAISVDDFNNWIDVDYS